MPSYGADAAQTYVDVSQLQDWQHDTEAGYSAADQNYYPTPATTAGGYAAGFDPGTEAGPSDWYGAQDQSRINFPLSLRSLRLLDQND